MTAAEGNKEDTIFGVDMLVFIIGVATISVLLCLILFVLVCIRRHRNSKLKSEINKTQLQTSSSSGGNTQNGSRWFIPKSTASPTDAAQPDSPQSDAANRYLHNKY